MLFIITLSVISLADAFTSEYCHCHIINIIIIISSLISFSFIISSIYEGPFSMPLWCLIHCHYYHHYKGHQYCHFIDVYITDAIMIDMPTLSFHLLLILLSLPHYFHYYYAIDIHIIIDIDYFHIINAVISLR